jgi:hypothetical protein
MMLGLYFFLVSFVHGQMNLGFYAQDAKEIPVAVQVSKEKIFKITMPYYLQVTPKDYEKILLAPKFPAESKAAIQSCVDNKSEVCIMPFAQIEGTAFLGKSPDVLWTNCHIVAAWMNSMSHGLTFTKSEDVRIFFKTQNLPMKLMNNYGESVWAENDKAYVKSFAVPYSLEGIEPVCNARDDMIKIQLDRNLSDSGLSWSKDSATTVYMGGYPRATTSREPLGKTDSDGKQFYWTFGDHIDKDSPEGLAYLEQKPNLDLVLSGTYTKSTLFDSIEGMSGSPVLNSKGEVLGIYNSFIPISKEQKDIPFLSLYIDTGGMRFLEILSGE